jgi:hypothetical protein
MIFGADTGLLFALLESNPIALTHWQRVLSGQDRMVWLLTNKSWQCSSFSNYSK